MLAYANESVCNFNVRENIIMLQRVNKMQIIFSLKINNRNNLILKNSFTYLYVCRISTLDMITKKVLHKGLTLSAYVLLYEKEH